MKYLNKEGLLRYNSGINKRFSIKRNLIELDEVIGPDTYYAETLEKTGTLELNLHEDENVKSIEIDIINEEINETTNLTLLVNEIEYDFPLGDVGQGFYGEKDGCFDAIEIKKNDTGSYDVVINKKAKRNPSGIIIGDNTGEIYTTTIEIDFIEGNNTITLKQFPNSIIRAKREGSTLGYNIGLNYQVGNDSLEIFYCDTKLKKDIDYQEEGNEGEISNSILFLDTIGDLDMSGVEGFEDFKETLEFIVRR